MSTLRSTAPSLTVLLPALDEESCIEQAVEAALARCDQLRSIGLISIGRIVVVDDGSTDATPQLLARLVADHPEVEVVTHETNRGLGAAIRSGLRAVATDLVFYTDADMPVDLVLLDDALPLLDLDHDVVAAYRSTRRGEGPRRFVYSLVYNALVRVVLGLRVRDVNFAAKLIRTRSLDGVDLRSEGSFIDAELLCRLARRGARIAQLPAVYHPRSKGVSTLSSMRVVLHILDEMARLAPEIRRERAVVHER